MRIMAVLLVGVLLLSIIIAVIVGVPTLIVSGMVVASIIFVIYQYGRSGAVGTNFSVGRRIEMVTEFVGKTRRELVIYSGNLSSPVYENDKVVDAFRRLPEDCRICLVLESPDGIDSRCVDLKIVLKDRWKKVRENNRKELFQIFSTGGKELTKRHFMISDLSRIRLELSDFFSSWQKENDGKFAIYLSGSMRFARKSQLFVKEIFDKKLVYEIDLFDVEKGK